MWIEHHEVLYNLDLFKAVLKGNDQEILLSNAIHEQVWRCEDIRNMAVLIFNSMEDRDKAFNRIASRLNTVVF